MKSTLLSGLSAALADPADQSAQAQLVPRSQASGRGVPHSEANAHQGLSQSGSGCLGKKTHRTGPVLSELLKGANKRRDNNQLLILHLMCECGCA